jgi:ATPase family associated with various cellular activities (AAA)
MTYSTPVINETEPAVDWSAANQLYLRAEMDRLRLLLKLHALRLRRLWRREQAQMPSGFRPLVISDAEADALLEEKAEDEASDSYEHGEREILDLLEKQQLRISDARALCIGAPPALVILAQLFRLGRLEQDILLLCLAPELDNRFERLYAYLQDDVARRYPTAALAQDALLAGQRAAPDIRLALSPGSPLRRYRLLRADSSSGTSWNEEPLRLDRRVGDYLLGINRHDEQIETLARPIAGSATLDPASEELVRHLELRVREWQIADRRPLMQILGPLGTSSAAVAKELCARLGVGLYALDPAQLGLPAADRHATCRLLERESLLLPCAYFIDGSSIDRNEGAQLSSLREFVLECRSLLFLGSRELYRLEVPQIVARLAVPDLQLRCAMWRDALPDDDTSDGFISRLVGQFSFTAEQIALVVVAAREAAMQRGAMRPSAADLWGAARDQAARSMQGLVDRIHPHSAFENLVLPVAQLQQLRDIASQVELRSRVYEELGFGAKMSRGKGISVLFAGPSGTGKTMAAEVLAGYLDLDLYRIDLAGVVSKYIGETEKNLRRLFDAAEESGAILFFDEADALFGKRSEVRDSHDRYANIEIDYLLQRMEEYRGLAILATNRKSLLDPAFMRRLRFLVEFTFPAAANRVRIWKTIFPAQAKIDGLDYDFLGRLEIAGGNISNIALNAAFRASGEGSPINMHHVLAAARQEYDKIDKMVLESEFGRYYAAVRR